MGKTDPKKRKKAGVKRGRGVHVKGDGKGCLCSWPEKKKEKNIKNKGSSAEDRRGLSLQQGESRVRTGGDKEEREKSVGGLGAGEGSCPLGSSQRRRKERRSVRKKGGKASQGLARRGKKGERSDTYREVGCFGSEKRETGRSQIAEKQGKKAGCGIGGRSSVRGEKREGGD
ncbi:hypothetical protein FF1_000009 [Malus domestica]